MPSPGKAAASTALPQPPKTSQKVPMNSATALFVSDIGTSSGRVRQNRYGPNYIYRDRFGDHLAPGERGCAQSL